MRTLPALPGNSSDTFMVLKNRLQGQVTGSMSIKSATLLEVYELSLFNIQMMYETCSRDFKTFETARLPTNKYSFAIDSSWYLDSE